jgi:hypothetical protein
VQNTDELILISQMFFRSSDYLPLSNKNEATLILTVLQLLMTTYLTLKLLRILSALAQTLTWSGI